jgi:hypothetical protein
VNKRAVTSSLLAVLGALAACDGDSHIFQAQQYEPAQDCVDLGVAIDVISGGASSYGCSPECLVYDAPDAAQVIFVSNQCGPYPTQDYSVESQADIGDASDPCGRAIAAFLRDGGVCAPADGGEAGTPEASDAGADAADGAPE